MTTPHLARRHRAQDIQDAIQTAKKVKSGQKCSTWVKLLILKMQLRFTANDANPQSIVEGGLDAFSITMVDCCTTADGDMDNNGVVNGEDLRLFVEAAMGTPSMAALCHGDFTGDGVLAADDVPPLVAACLAP